MKTLLTILAFVIVGVAAVFLWRGCNSASDPRDKVIDSLKFAMKMDSTQYAARASLSDQTIKGLVLDLDTTRWALDSTRKVFSKQGKEILATNKRLRQAFNNHDTLTVYEGCDSLSHAVDSIAQVKWDLDRELDGMVVLIQQIRDADSAALADCRGTLKKTQTNCAMLVSNYAVDHEQDKQALKKAKRGKWLWGAGGGILGAAIRSIFK